MPIGLTPGKCFVTESEIPLTLIYYGTVISNIVQILVDVSVGLKFVSYQGAQRSVGIIYGFSSSLFILLHE